MRLEQGDIIKLNLDPTKGHEQAGYRPAVVVSGDTFNSFSQNRVICPVTNTDRRYPAHTALDERTATRGFVMCDQVRTIDPSARDAHFVEKLPDDVLEEVLDILAGILNN